MGSLRIAHSRSMDVVDRGIIDAREALEEVRKDLLERLYRWNQIESLTHLQIKDNPGFSELKDRLSGREQVTPLDMSPTIEMFLEDTENFQPLSEPAFSPTRYYSRSLNDAITMQQKKASSHSLSCYDLSENSLDSPFLMTRSRSIGNLLLESGDQNLHNFGRPYPMQLSSSRSPRSNARGKDVFARTKQPLPLVVTPRTSSYQKKETGSPTACVNTFSEPIITPPPSTSPPSPILLKRPDLSASPK